MKTTSVLFVACSALLLSACSGGDGEKGAVGGGGGDGGGGGPLGATALAMLATDSAFVGSDIIAEATFTIDRITIAHEEDGDGGWIVLHEGEPLDLVLTDIVGGVTQSLGEHELEAGTYSEIRLRVAHASLDHTNGTTYSTDDDTIHLSSQGTSGFKVKLDPPIVLAEGTTAELLLDFNMAQTFKPIPANDPENPNRFNLHPVIRSATLSLAGGIEGTVTQDDGQGGFPPVEGATVHVLPPGATDTAQSIASTTTAADGTYEILGLVEGTYDVMAEKDGLQVSALGVVVAAGAPTVVDLVLPPPPSGTIAGFVRQDPGTGLVPVAGANVFVLPPGVTDTLQAVATAVTAADGSYTMSNILVGTYDVLATSGTLQVSATGIAVTDGATTTVDLVLPPPPTGGIAGIVRRAVTLVPVAGANVFVLPPGVTDPLQAVATAVTAADGSYSIASVLVGTYDVRAEQLPSVVTAAGIVVADGAVTPVDLVLP